MTQLFPFTDPNPGWGPGKKLKSTDLATVSANSAQAADGNVWSDVAVAKNFRKSTLTGGGLAIFWDAFSGRWINGGTSGGNPTAQFSYDVADDWLGLTVPAGTNWNLTACGATSGAGSMILCGGGGSATASKIRQSADGGTTWNARNTNASGTESVNCAVWHSGASLFVVGLTSSTTTNVETSPDGVTWTQQTAPNALPRGYASGAGSSAGAASSGTAIVMLTAGSSNQCIRSTDAVTWAAITLPATIAWSAVAYNARSRKWMVLGVSGIATSTDDGLTWSTTGLALPFTTNIGSLVTYGRMWIATGTRGGSNNVVAVSIDDGVSWRNVKLTAALMTQLAVGDNQICAVATGASYSSIRAGL